MHLARTGRPGPVWIDLPLDVQGADDRRGRRCAPSIPGGTPAAGLAPGRSSPSRCAAPSSCSTHAERPVVLIGNGVRLGSARAEMRALIERLGLPVLTTWPAHDMVPDDHPLMVGRPGPAGAARREFHAAEFRLAARARRAPRPRRHGLCAAELRARGAKKIMVDIDAAELRKMDGTIARAGVRGREGFHRGNDAPTR